MRVLVSGGGTGGHIYPALAVASVLRDRYQADIVYMGDRHGLETTLVPAAGFPFVAIDAGKLRRYLAWRTLTDLGRVPIGLAQALRQLRAFRPAVVFTSGGYVSVPAGFAARMQRVPLLVHQQDVSPNLANRLIAPLATRISVSFADSLRYFPTAKTALMGNPVRDVIIRAAGGDRVGAKRRLGLHADLPMLLVTGGSQGARHLNQVVTGALPRLLPHGQVVHISGRQNYAETRCDADAELVGAADWRDRYYLYPYLDEPMADALLAADLVICRAGAATLSELAILGTPSLLVPLPPGFGGSPQEVNAAMFVRAGAADMIEDASLTVDRLVAAVLTLLHDEGRLAAMRRAAAQLAHPHAAAEIAAAVAALAGTMSSMRRVSSTTR
jgi:UDP-N-acetylglucosamine--N-acetylmuramyl-(pentapeptide) pyrophosphoryl-undecaprenol N-acetylglucosamine transferase